MKKLDLDKIELMKKALLENPQTRIKPYGGLTVVGVPKGGSGLDLWKKILGPDLIKYLEDNTYPYGNSIDTIRGNIYKKGDFFNLHIDNLQSKEDFFSGKKDSNIKHVTSITLYKSEDLIGGEIIIGDTWDIWNTFELDVNMNHIPLKIINPNIGDCVYWDWNTLHGVTQIKQGTRLSLLVLKNG